MYADLDANERLVRLGERTAEGYDADTSGTSTTKLTDSSDSQYDRTAQPATRLCWMVLPRCSPDAQVRHPDGDLPAGVAPL